MKIEDLEFITVYWADIVSWASWKSLKDDYRPAHCTTRGWVLKDTEEFIILFDTFNVKPDGQIDEISGITLIPKGCIKGTTK